MSTGVSVFGGTELTRGLVIGSLVAAWGAGSGCGPGIRSGWWGIEVTHPSVQWTAEAYGATALEHFLYLPGCVFLTDAAAEISEASIQGQDVIVSVSSSWQSCSGRLLGPGFQSIVVDIETGRIAAKHSAPDTRAAAPSAESLRLTYHQRNLFLHRGERLDDAGVRIARLRGDWLQDGTVMAPVRGSSSRRLVFEVADRFLLCIDAVGLFDHESTGSVR